MNQKINFWFEVISLVINYFTSCVHENTSHQDYK